MKEYRDLTHDELMNVCDEMKRFGGSFSAALADCIYKADYQNKRKLIEAFPEYFKKKI